MKLKLIEQLSKNYADERFGLSEEEEHQSAERAHEAGILKGLELAAQETRQTHLYDRNIDAINELIIKEILAIAEKEVEE